MDLRTEAALARWHGGPCVYFAEDRLSGAIKIGFTRNLPERARSLAIECGPFRSIRMLASAPGAFQDEKRLHRFFWDLRQRVNGRVAHEWFVPGDGLVSLVRYVTRLGELPPSLAPYDCSEEACTRWARIVRTCPRKGNG